MRNTKKLLQFIQQEKDSQKEMNFFHYLRRSVEKNAGGTSRYIIKHGINKGKVV